MLTREEASGVPAPRQWVSRLTATVRLELLGQVDAKIVCESGRNAHVLSAAT
jgi:hypothetical protein